MVLAADETGEAHGSRRFVVHQPSQLARTHHKPTTTMPSQQNLPRVAISYCTQCKWMLRAAYFGQELLSTFGTAIGEIALIPATGGLFTVYLTHVPPGSEEGTEAQEILLWDRKAEGGFCETKVLKQRLRNHIEPGRDLGHSDKPSKTQSSDTTNQTEPAQDPPAATVEDKKDCEDCK
jgi:selT/selW/selH-like putative selenoprotein